LGLGRWYQRSVSHIARIGTQGSIANALGRPAAGACATRGRQRVRQSRRSLTLLDGAVSSVPRFHAILGTMVRSHHLPVLALVLVASGCGGTVTNRSTDTASCMIAASSYDQSCAVDSDCVQVTPGDYCGDDRCLCDVAAISATALAQFDADVSKTPVGLGAVRYEPCSCGNISGGVCCRTGACTRNCVSAPSDTLASCADAGTSGGRCVMASEVTCAQPGPPNSCAYSDEICCPL
jgi:hypothetical protein